MIQLIFAISTAIVSANVDYSYNLNIGTLNDAFPTEHSFTEDSWGWSWSVYLVEDNILLGMENIRGNQISEVGMETMDLSYNSRVFELGYVADFTQWLFYFKGGGGYSRMNLGIESVADSLTFSGIINDPGGSTDLKTSVLSLSAGGGLIIPLTNNLAVNVSGGYLHSLGETNWVLERGGEVYEDPDMRPNQFYIKAGIMYGNLAKEQQSQTQGEYYIQ